jgi:excisionase family DNA binding protein
VTPHAAARTTHKGDQEVSNVVALNAPPRQRRCYPVAAPRPAAERRSQPARVLEPQPAVKALYRITEAMVLLSLSRTVIYELLSSGRLRSVSEGRARRIPASAIAEYVQLLETEALNGAS